MAQKLTTIPIIPRVRDRLKTYGTQGETYSAIIVRVLDEIDKKAFVARLRAERDDPKTEWVALEDLKWDA